MKRERLNLFVFCILTLVIVLYFTKKVRNEGFFDNTYKEGSTEKKFEGILKDMDSKKSKSVNIRFYYEI